MVLIQISYSFDEVCFIAVAISKKKRPRVFLIVGIFFKSGPVFSQVKEMK